MMEKITRVCLTLLFTFLVLPVWSKPTDSIYFNSSQAEELLNSVDGNVKSLYVNNNLLKQQIDRLELLHTQTQECITKLRGKIKKISNILKDNPEQRNYSNKNLSYLTERKSLFQNQLAQCEIYSFRIDEALTHNKKKMYLYTTQLLFKHSMPLWQLGKGDAQSWQLNWRKSSFLPELKGISTINWLSYLIILIVVSIAAKFTMTSFIKADKRRQHGSFYYAMRYSFSLFLIPFIMLVTTVIITHWYIENPYTVSGLELATKRILVYCLTLALLHFLFCSHSRNYNPFDFSPQLNQCLFRRSAITVTVILLFKLVAIYFYDVVISMQIKTVYNLTHSLSFYGLLIWCLLPALGYYRTQERYVNVAIIMGTMLWFFLAVALEIIGYHNFSNYLSFSLLSTIVALIALVSLVKFMGNWFYQFKQKQTLFAVKVYSKLGVKPHRHLIEMDMIRIALYIVLGLGFIYLCMYFWTFPVIWLERFSSGMINGFQFLGFNIIPSRLTIAIILFAIINMLARLVSTNIARKRQFSEEKESQVAVASIVSYLGFSIAAMVAFIVAGFNFTSLAIILGALSVGIGLGLRGIVNNFISGIILLIEKPIKPGDRIIVGNTEGHVERVRIRSTQIRTRSREDVIVPNEDLITSQVTNLMFRDKNWRISCQIGVSYDSDVELVKKLLLDVGNAHPQVVKGARSPQVLFRQFGDSTLDFQLRCVVKDVNQKNFVVSDLNFAILESFRQHGIEISYPQRDVHIKKDSQ